MVVLASGPMGMRVRCGGRHERLAGQDDMAGLMLFG